jgi:hypothetical protein
MDVSNVVGHGVELGWIGVCGAELIVIALCMATAWISGEGAVEVASGGWERRVRWKPRFGWLE